VRGVVEAHEVLVDDQRAAGLRLRGEARVGLLRTRA
jgi:hypothetical protein